MSDKMRDEFEAWQARETPGADLAHCGALIGEGPARESYRNMYVAERWIGWRASRKSTEALIADIDRITDLNRKQFGDAIRKNSEVDQHKTESQVLRKDLESHKRMLLAAVCDLGAIGEALKSDMDADGDELLGMVIDLKAQNTRMLEWLKDISRTSGDKGAVMGARQLLKEFAQ